jgi:hypothetical protein
MSKRPSGSGSACVISPGRADRIDRGRAVVVRPIPRLQQHHADDAIAGEGIGHHRPVTRLEDVQREKDVGEQDDVREREEGNEGREGHWGLTIDDLRIGGLIDGLRD